MNVYVSVDIEGISGIVHGDMMMPEERFYERGCRLMTQDANSAVEGLIGAGASYVLVNDSHGPMRNLLIEELHPDAHLLSGSGDAKDFCQLQGADSEQFDAAVFIGYHAMANTPQAIHPHTIAGSAVAELRINGTPHGETGLNAAVLASLGIPTVLVSGDTATMDEVRSFLPPKVEMVAVKHATGRNAAICRPLSIARDEIVKAAERGLKNRKEIGSYNPAAPWELELDFVRMQQCDRAARTSGAKRSGPLTVAIHGESPWEQYMNLWACLRSALYEPGGWLS